MPPQHFSAPMASALLASALRGHSPGPEGSAPGAMAAGDVLDDGFEAPPREQVIAAWREAAARDAAEWVNRGQHLPPEDLATSGEQAGLPDGPMAVMRWIRDVLRCYLALEEPRPGKVAITAHDFTYGFPQPPRIHAHDTPIDDDFGSISDVVGQVTPSAWLSGWLIGPPSTGRIEWDVMLAAVTEHEFTAAGHAAPAWTRTVAMTHDWVLEAPFDVDEETLRRVTPDWLARRRIFGLPGSI